MSRACSNAKYQGKRRGGCKRSGRYTTIYHGASFGEAAFANISKGKAYLTFLLECRNVASLDDMFAIFLQEVEAKVAHMTVEAFVLPGSHALRPMPHNLSWGLASARQRGHSVHEGQAHFLVLGEFYQIPMEYNAFAFGLPELGVNVTHLTAEAFLFSGVV